MKPEDAEALISYRMQRAEESFRVAEIMYEKNMFSFAMNRIYYSMFYWHDKVDDVRDIVR